MFHANMKTQMKRWTLASQPRPPRRGTLLLRQSDLIDIYLQLVRIPVHLSNRKAFMNCVNEGPEICNSNNV